VCVCVRLCTKCVRLNHQTRRAVRLRGERERENYIVNIMADSHIIVCVCRIAKTKLLQNIFVYTYHNVRRGGGEGGGGGFVSTCFRVRGYVCVQLCVVFCTCRKKRKLQTHTFVPTQQSEYNTQGTLLATITQTEIT
jgi:hypothetical protein